MPSAPSKFSINTIILLGLAVVLVFPSKLRAQAVNLMYIHPGASIVAHPNSQVSIFSDITNNSVFTTHTTSAINFYGKTWQNLNAAKLPDESPNGLDATGGIFTFWGIYNGAQNIITTNPGPTNGFPNITINNLQHVTAETGGLYINNDLNFVNGSLILNNVNVTVGRSGLGTISGYSENGFVATGTGFTGGYLIRNVTGAQGPVDFPVGTAPGSYTPAAVNYIGAPQAVKFRVANDVYQKPAFPEYVYKTWMLAADFPDPKATVDLTLQHNSTDEGIEYFRNRTEAYVTRYTKTLTGLWDIIPPTPSITPGTITSKTPISNAFMNSRTPIGSLASIEYFSKSVIKKLVDQNTPSFIPEAISPNGDGLNDTYKLVKRLPTDVIRLEIYSRNQVLVYQDFNYLNTFNGIGNIGGFLGNVLPDGIYYYLISANNAKGIPGYLIINR